MFDYTGYECKACGKEFTQDDDIVVCPECGTPYHRECYSREGGCVNTALHESGSSWRAEREAEEKKNGPEVFCRSCGKKLNNEQFFCDRCGAPTEAFAKSKGINTGNDENGGFASDYQRRTMETLHPFMINYSDPLCGYNADEQIGEDVTIGDVGNFVKTNTHYYLPKFKLMKSSGFKVSFNFTAMLFPELYFANRKMPLMAALILILKTIISIPSAAVSLQLLLLDDDFGDMFRAALPFSAEVIEKIISLNLNSGSFATLSDISSIVYMILIFVFAGFSNYFYYRHVLNKAAKVKAQAISEGRSAAEALRENGGTSLPMMIIFLVLYILSSYAAMGIVGLLLV